MKIYLVSDLFYLLDTLKQHYLIIMPKELSHIVLSKPFMCLNENDCGIHIM